jgi:hypothetical protein
MTTTCAAYALFTSTLQPSEHPTLAQASSSAIESLRQHGGPHGCEAAWATAYGENPFTAPSRMRWALTLAQQVTAGAQLAA